MEETSVFKKLWLQLFYQNAALFYTKRRGLINIDIKRKASIFENHVRVPTAWPNKARSVFNLQMDDCCPKDSHYDCFDYGGDLKGPLWRHLEDLLTHPKLRVNLFIISDAIFVEKGFYRGEWARGTWSVLNHPAFVEKIKSYPRVEPSCHGLYHYQDNVKHFLKAREFEFLNKQISRIHVEKAFELLDRVGFKPRGFKPSGWGIGHNSGFGLLEALKTVNLSFSCLSTPISGLNWEMNRVSNIYPSYYEGLLTVPQNVSLNWTLERILYEADRIVDQNGIITLQGHFNRQYNWMSDGLGTDSVKKIKALLKHLDTKYPDEIWYASLGEIADLWRKQNPKPKKVKEKQ